MLTRILTSLDDDKAEEIATIDLKGRAAFCDAIVIATGRSSRHVASIAEHLARRLKEAGYGTRPVNGAQQGARKRTAISGLVLSDSNGLRRHFLPTRNRLNRGCLLYILTC